MTYSCPLCRTPYSTLKLYVGHLRVVHSKDPTFDVLCGVGGCREVFRTFSAFNSHIYRHHRKEIIGIEENRPLLQIAPSITGASSSAEDMDTEIDPHCDQPVSTEIIGIEENRPLLPIAQSITGASSSAEDMDTKIDPHCDQPVSTSTTSMRQSTETSEDSCSRTTSAAKMLLKLREGHQVSQVAISEIVSMCRSICGQMLDEIRAGITLECDNLHLILDKDFDPFQNIGSNYLFEKFCMDHFGYLEPEEIQFGEPYYVDQVTASAHRKVLKSDKFYYIPLCKTVQQLLSLEDYQAEILNPHRSISKESIADFCDGTVFKLHPLFSTDPYALQIIGYYDDVEVVNPLGSYTKKHKLGCLFFFLGNVRPQFRSTHKSNHLVAVGKTQDIQKYGLNAFLLPFVEDLKKLFCNGITVSIDGTIQTFHGTLLAFLADTLAAHAVGGFKGSMSFALRVCRTCMITSEQLQGCFLESSCTLRTSNSYFEQCSLLSGPLKGHYSTLYGLNNISVLEEVPCYSVINGLPHDIMHDLYEGIVPYEMKLLLCHCLKEKYCTIDEINGRIERYGFRDNKPRLLDPLINPASKIRQSASQMMSLSHQLPLLIGDKIPSDDSRWKFFLLLLKICSTVNSPIVTPDTVAYLRILIEEKLSNFKDIYPNDKLLPKHHYMVHYPSQILRLGPLIHSWTMRQESKLSFVKRVSHLSNYKNICKTVAKKHQFWMCYQLQGDVHYLSPSFTASPKFKSNTLHGEDECIRSEFLRLIPNLDLNSEIKHLVWLKIQSSSLQKGVFVMLHYDIDTPSFGQVVDILCFDSTILLYVQKYVSQFFVSHYNAFLLKQLGEFIVVNLWHLKDHRPVVVQSTFSTDQQLYALLPYYY